MENDAILRRYTNLPVLIDMLVREQITILGYNHWVDANDRRGLELYQDKLRFGFVGAMCLTMASETFHHWQIFAQGESGVCIVFDRGRLEAALRDREHFIAKPVDYVQLNAIGDIDPTDIHRLPFLKRYGFRDEREYRLLAFAAEQHSSMAVRLTPDLIQRVVFSPFTHPNIVASLKIALRSLPVWRGLSVGRSHLTANETWQGALQDMVVRHGIEYGDWEPIDPRALLGPA
ncbi:DUF2971 domain-containing protein [uncultured Sphingomonas sp.]|uniref:DUF2971 domain-containing protein n=1 Tax=uncultured Sphingomonas sp. TaxID=158754 RepID=UPI002600A2F9|nr:DUF2971 domain-containing protein [uncultured Sphingomonas sp.]